MGVLGIGLPGMNSSTRQTMTAFVTNFSSSYQSYFIITGTKLWQTEVKYARGSRVLSIMHYLCLTTGIMGNYILYKIVSLLYF
jgi:hypothetical protein